MIIEFGSLSDWVTAGSTLAVALLTAFLWMENRRLRNAGSSPLVVAYLSSHTDGNGAVEFVLSNVGHGPAFQLNFTFECDESDFKSHKVLLINDAERMSTNVLPQGESIRALFGIGFELYGNLGDTKLQPLKPFRVRVTYKNSSGKIHSDNRTIDIRQFAGLRGVVAKSNPAKMAQTLEKIEGHLSVISRQAGRFSAFVDVTELRDEVVRKKKGDPEE